MTKLNKLLPVLLAILLLGWYLARLLEGTPPKSSGEPMVIQLRRTPFTVYAFPSKKPETAALVLFGSGDWGWGDWEESVSYSLQDAGCAVVGIDSMDYAKTDYDLDTLQSDFTQIARAARGHLKLHDQPLIIGGFSMGAEQAVPLAGGPHPPPGIAGLLLVSPGKRGRYGLRGEDRMDLPPTGPGTFALEDFAKNMGNLPIAQWHAGLDFTDSITWLNALTAPHHEFVFPHALHNYNYGCQDFRVQLVKSVTWILNPTPENASAVQSEN